MFRALSRVSRFTRWNSEFQHMPIRSFQSHVADKMNLNFPARNTLEQEVWKTLKEEAVRESKVEPCLASFYESSILRHSNLSGSISYILAHLLGSPDMNSMLLREVVSDAMANDPLIVESSILDLKAFNERDPACKGYYMPLLFFKGWHATQSYRIAHWLYKHNRTGLAFYIQNRMGSVFGVDIHPAAQIGHGIMLDHATGIVIGETTVIKNGVSLLHNVTLGGTGKEGKDRHPKIGHDVLISVGSQVLGNIKVGDGAKIGAGSVVLAPVPPHTTVVGVPAKVIGAPKGSKPAAQMNQNVMLDMEEPHSIEFHL